MNYADEDRDSRPQSGARRDIQNGEGSYSLNSSQSGHNAPPPRRRSPSNSSSTAISQSTQPTTSRSFNNSPLANSSSNQRNPNNDNFSSEVGHRSQASASTVRGPPTSLPGGESLHDMDRAVGLLKGSKFYAEGFLMKRVEVGADGKAVRYCVAHQSLHDY